MFDPAALTSARLALTPDDLDDVRMGDAVGYHPGWVYHGLITGTVADAARLLRLATDGTLLRASSLAEMLTSRALPEHRGPRHPDPAYGLGLMLAARDPLAHPLGHTGEGPGSQIAAYTRRGRVAAIWTAMPADPDAETGTLGILATPP